METAQALEREFGELLSVVGARRFGAWTGFGPSLLRLRGKTGFGCVSLDELVKLARACERVRGVLADMERAAESLGNCEESAEGG